jgi:hypothetical protein
MPTPLPQAPEPVRKPDDDAIPCAIFDDMRGRPCGEPVEAGTLTCSKHRARQTRTQISRVDAARRRGGR